MEAYTPIRMHARWGPYDKAVYSGAGGKEIFVGIWGSYTKEAECELMQNQYVFVGWVMV